MSGEYGFFSAHAVFVDGVRRCFRSSDLNGFRLIFFLAELQVHPAEDVVHDGLRDRNLRVAGEAGWLESHVHELVGERIKRHAILQGEAD